MYYHLKLYSRGLIWCYKIFMNYPLPYPTRWVIAQNYPLPGKAITLPELTTLVRTRFL